MKPTVRHKRALLNFSKSEPQKRTFIQAPSGTFGEKTVADIIQWGWITEHSRDHIDG